MQVTLPLEEMSIEEKIQTMEAIWNNLCQKAQNISSPSWHEQVLSDREQGVKNGYDKFTDWSKAKKDIQNSA